MSINFIWVKSDHLFCQFNFIKFFCFTNIFVKDFPFLYVAVQTSLPEFTKSLTTIKQSKTPFTLGLASDLS